MSERALPPVDAAQFSAILDSIDEQFVVFDRDWRVRYANAAAARAFRALGRPREEVLGREFWSLFPELVGTRFHARALAVPVTGETVAFDEFYAPGGRWFAGRISPWPDGIVSYSRDVTDLKAREEALRTSEARFRTLVQSIDDLVYELDPGGQVVMAFGRWLQQSGLDPVPVGRPVGELLPGTSAAEHEAAHRQALAGQSVLYEWTWRGPDGACFMQTALTPLRDRDGSVSGVVGLGRDITARVRAEQRQRFVTEAGAALSASLDYEITLERVARLAVSTLADLCVVDLLEPDGTVRRVAAAHRDPAQAAQAEGLRAFPPDAAGENPVARVLRTGQTLVLPRLDDALLEASAPEADHLALLRGMALQSQMVVPLLARGRTIGALSLLAAGEPRAHAPEDVTLAEELALRAALAVDNARLFNEAQAEIEERRRAAEEIARLNRVLQRRVAEMETLLAVLPVGICVALDAEAERLRVNPALAELLGLPAWTAAPEGVPRETLAAVEVRRSGRRLARAELPLTRVVRERVPVDGEELEVRGADGATRTLLCHAAPLYDAPGAVRGAVGVFVDISARKRQEARERFVLRASRILASSLEYERTLPALASVAVADLADLCVVDVLADGRVDRIAAAAGDPGLAETAQRMRTYRPDPASPHHPVALALRSGEPTFLPEVTDADLQRIVADAPDAGPYLAAVRPVSLMTVPLLAHGQAFGAITFACVARSGRRLGPDDLAAALDVGGRAALAIDNARLYRSAQAELAQRTAAEAELRRWAHIFEHAGWGVLIGHADGETMVSMNPAFAAMHDREVGELTGRPVGELVAPEVLRSWQQGIALARQRGRHVFESRHRRRDGSFPVLVDVTAVPGDGDEVAYFAVNVQDLSAQRRVEEQVHQAQKMDAVGRLAGGVAHDFNNMLMIILGFADFLLAGLDPDDPRRGDADEIRRAAERASALTRQLLAFGRQQVVEPQTVDLNGVIRDMERMLRPLLGEGIRLGTRLAPNLGGVRADRGQLEQVLMNLALNARDAMEGEGRLTIETMNVHFPEGYALSTLGLDLPEGRYVLLVVSDTGRGMDAEVRSRLFEPFFTTKSATQHSGLGLATVYGIVKQSGGYIWVESEARRGASFKLCFPLVEAPERAGSVTEPAGTVGGSERILVVEDEAAVRSLARRVLEEQGYEVLTAAHGGEALALLAEGRPVQLVVTDVVMPVMGGAELGARLAEEHPEVPILYMSGYTDNDVLRRGLDRAGSRMLHKPFSPDSLVRKVREVLDQTMPAAAERS